VCAERDEINGTCCEDSSQTWWSPFESPLYCEICRHWVVDRPNIFIEKPSALDRPQAGGYRCVCYSAGNRQLQKFVNFRRGVDVHDALPQFFALILANGVTAERGEFHRDFFLGHWIAGIALGYIHTGAV
jgi:hypothetical protein